MDDDTSTPDADWLKAREVAYDLGPISEWWDEHGQRQGLEMVLFAAAPEGADPGDDDADRAWLRLRALALSLVPDAVPEQSRSPRPYRAAFVYRPETGRQAEVRAAIRLFPPSRADWEEHLRAWRSELEEAVRTHGIPRRVWRDA
jgi:hypothetical protein